MTQDLRSMELRKMRFCVILSIFCIVHSYHDEDKQRQLTAFRTSSAQISQEQGLGGDAAQQENAPASGSQGFAVEIRRERKQLTGSGGKYSPLRFESARDLSCSLHRGITLPSNDQESNIFYHNASTIGRLSKLGLSFPVAPPEGSKLPRIIWSFWDGPAMAEVEKLALSSWRLMNPGWDVRVLNFESAMGLLQTESETLMTRAFIEKLNSWERKTDLIRLMLLQRFGGVWVDATLFCTRPLDSYVFDMVGKANFSAPTWGIPRQPCGSPAGPGFTNNFLSGLSNHFLVAVPHSYIVERWLYAFSQLLYNGPCGDSAEWEYFFAQTVFESLIDTDPRFARMWEEALKLNSGDTHSVWYLEAPLTPQLKERLDHPRAPVWKFNKMTGNASVDARRCTDVSFACGYIKSRLQNEIVNSSARVSYLPRVTVNICNPPDLWLDISQSSWSGLWEAEWEASQTHRFLEGHPFLCRSMLLLLMVMGLYVWLRRCSLQSSIVK